MIILVEVLFLIFAWLAIGCFSTMLSIRILDRIDEDAHDEFFLHEEHRYLITVVFWPFWLIAIAGVYIAHTYEINEDTLLEKTIWFFSLLRKKKDEDD